MGAGDRTQASPVRIWDCLAAASSGDVRGFLDIEAGGAGALDNLGGGAGTSGGGGIGVGGGVGGGGGRGFVEKIGGSGGEAAGALACQRLLIEAGAFERFGYSDMAVACALPVLQVSVFCPNFCTP